MGNLFYKKNSIFKNSLFLVIFIAICVFFYYFIFIKNNVLYMNNKKIIKKREKSKIGLIEKKEEKLPNWDLTDLYFDIYDSNIEKDLKIAEEKIDYFVKNYKGSIKQLNSNKFYMSLQNYEEIMEILYKLSSFAQLKYSENSSDETNIIFYQKIIENITKLSNELIFYPLEINKLDDWEVEKKVSDNKILIKNYYQFLLNLRLAKPYQLNENLEKLFTDKAMTGNMAMVRLFDETINNTVFVYKNNEYNESEILQKLYDNKNSTERKELGKIFGEKLSENIKLYAFITNTLAKDKSISDEWRKFETPMAERNLSNLIEDEVVDNLEKSVVANYEKTSHRYYKLKAKMLKQKTLHYTDRNAPLPFKNDKKYTWGEAKNIVLSAYGNFSPEMANIAKLFFEKNWIDAPTRKGKRGGAFSHSTVPSVHPYILLNFQGTENDIMTLAHELGHGIHQYLSRDLGLFNSDTPLTIAETASVFGEQLTFRYLLSKQTKKEDKISLIARKVESMLNTTTRQIAFYRFEKEIHLERRNGELTIDKINEIWMETQKESLGDIFEFDPEYKYYWSYVSHFIHSPFYVYAYAFGDCLVNSLYVNYLNNKETFKDKYLNLLKSGGSEKYTTLLEPFKLNPKNESFWDDGMQLIVELIDELEELLSKK